MSDIGFEGQVVVITGAGQGLGASHARAFAKLGARVVINDIPREGDEYSLAELLVDEIRVNGGEAIFAPAYIGTVDAAKSIVSSTIAVFGRIDILVNNAGVTLDNMFHKMPQDNIAKVMAIHLVGAMHLTRIVWDYMKEQGFGRIVNTTSAASFGNPGQANYSAAKLGLIGMTNTLALEGERHGIRVNAIAPIARTPMTDELFQKMGIDLALDPADITPVVIGLCDLTDECPTGRIIGCASGQLMEIELAVTWRENVAPAGALTPEAARDAINNSPQGQEVEYPDSMNDEIGCFLSALTV